MARVPARHRGEHGIAALGPLDQARGDHRHGEAGEDPTAGVDESDDLCLLMPLRLND